MLSIAHLRQRYRHRQDQDRCRVSPGLAPAWPLDARVSRSLNKDWGDGFLAPRSTLRAKWFIRPARLQPGAATSIDPAAVMVRVGTRPINCSLSASALHGAVYTLLGKGFTRGNL